MHSPTSSFSDVIKSGFLTLCSCLHFLLNCLRELGGRKKEERGGGIEGRELNMTPPSPRPPAVHTRLHLFDLYNLPFSIHRNFLMSDDVLKKLYKTIFPSPTFWEAVSCFSPFCCFPVEFASHLGHALISAKSANTGRSVSILPPPQRFYFAKIKLIKN